MKNKFIQLNRSFHILKINQDYGQEDYDTLKSLNFWESKKWDDLLKLPRVIILAEAGAGKTSEIRAVTEKQRKDGLYSFFLRLEYLHQDFETAIEIGTNDEFANWINSNEPAWIFLDSVDEAKLQNIQNFEYAIRKLGLKLNDNNCKKRAYIYITSRNSEWRAQYDFNLFKEKIPYFELLKVSEEDTEMEFDFNQNSISENQEKIGEQKLVDPIVFELKPLNLEQVKIFSKKHEIQNIDKFIAVIQKNELEIYTRRPEDLKELIEYWNSNGKIANHASMIQEIIKEKLIESDENRNRVLPLSLDDAEYGVNTLAASVSFIGKSRILVPDSPTDSSMKSKSINVSEILTTWESTKIHALLQRPIFDNEIYGTVRFHHRSILEYLTAKWLDALLKQGKSRFTIENLFFKKIYGEQVIVPSTRKILSWLILFDDQIRNKTIDIVPEIFLEGGDPSSLPFEIRKKILEKFCKRFENRNFSINTFSEYELCRFAHRDMTETINDFLEKYSSNLPVVHFLLRIAWLGEIQGCTIKAMEYVLDKYQDNYTRIYSIRIIEVSGSLDQKTEIIKYFESNHSENSLMLIREIIGAFGKENIISLKILFNFINRVNPKEQKNLHRTLKEYSLSICKEKNLLEFIKYILPLLKRQPTKKLRKIAISNKYRWLLPYAAFACERLIKVRNPDALDTKVLEILSMVDNEHIHYSYNHDEHKLGNIVPKWSKLNRLLFWNEVNLERSKLNDNKEARITELYQVESIDSIWKISINDLDWIISDINNKDNIDDRLVALSAAYRIYVEDERNRKLRERLKRIANSHKELKNKLNLFLNPPPMSDKVRKWKREDANRIYRRKKIEEKKQKDRIKWIQWLQKNTHILIDSSIAPSGKVWSQTNYLIAELRETENNAHKWGVSEWQKLIPEFGGKIATSFRDGCIEYWRKYRPKINSEEKEKLRSTPFAVSVGLSGIEMEMKENSDWPNQLTNQEAELACRYAVNDMNGFPDWINKLHSNFPDIVEESLLKEIEWEFSKYKDNELCHYVLADVLWHLENIKLNLSKNLIPIVNKYDPKHDDTLKNVFYIIFSSNELNKKNFLKVINSKLKSSKTLYRKALWYSAWLQIDAENAIKSLSNYLLTVKSNKKTTTQFAMYVITTLLGQRYEKFESKHCDYKKPKNLSALIILMHKYIRSSEDINHLNEGVYSPGIRDDAQNARGQLFEILKEIPGKETYHALLNISENHPDQEHQKWYKTYAVNRAEKDVDLVPWQPKDIIQFAKEAEHMPKNNSELYELTISRLTDLKADLEHGDSSISNMLKKEKDETEHRKFIGNWLRVRSVGKYNVPQEEELADGTKPDIRILGFGFDGPVPIELKIVDNNWSANKLIERLNNQLCGQYLRDIRSNCGIYLLVYRGKKKSWQHPTTKKKLIFEKLVEILEEETKLIVSNSAKIESLKIIGIDLTVRTKKK